MEAFSRQLTADERERLLKLATSLNLKSKKVAVPSVRRASRDEPIPLSFAQQRLWFLAQMDGGSAAYHIPCGWRLMGDLDHAVLLRALDRVVARHEALRTTFVKVHGEVVQRILSAEESRFHLVEHDLRKSGDTRAELELLIDDEAAAPFDLESGPLIRGRLIRQGEEQYTLLITAHHIIFDGWSLGILSGELETLYRAFLRDEDDPLSELAAQYADYTVWQRQWIEGELLQQQAEYWKRTLAGAPPVLNLTLDHARPAQQNYAGAWVELELDKDLTTGLKEVSRRHGATLFMTLLAAWAALLARLSGQQDIVIGTPVANRGQADLEGLIGFFVNTLALRLDVSGSPTVGELLQLVKAQAIAAQQHQDIPFERVVEIAQPLRSLSHNPLFQVMFAWNAPEGTIALEGVEVRSVVSAPRVIAKFDLTLSLQEAGDVIVGGFEYATTLFERSTIVRYQACFQTLLRGMVGGDDQAVYRLPLLDEKERKLLGTWNSTRVEYPSTDCVHEMFEQQVRKSPDALALVFEEVSLSYASLNARANRLAHYLCKLGVGPDTRVAICVERGPEMIVGLLAVLKAGGAYVPLDPAYPEERLQYMLADSAPAALLTQAHLQPRFRAMQQSIPILDLAAAAPAWNGEPETNPDRAGMKLKPEHLAYVIYTSGSTGNPKGVMVAHHNLVSSTFARKLAYGGYSRFLLLSPISFDSSVAGVFGTLINGGTLLIVAHEVIRDSSLLNDTIQDLHVDTLLCVPSLYQQLLEDSVTHRYEKSLSQVIVAGETCSPILVANSARKSPQALLFNEYGPTECTVWATLYRCNPQSERESIPIGHPIANARVYILDREGQQVPVGVVGEIYIGGAGVARGYLNRAELTAERFLADPFAGEEGARMYRTGDLGRWRSDGAIEFLGRNDFQVKIRGFRIELGEIEARLAEHAQVREAFVVAREETAGDKRLVAYYTSRASGEQGEQAVGAQELRAYLSARLPEYMVPSAYVRLESLPLTAHGKLDRKELPAPEGDVYAARGYEAPVGETETALAAIWAEVLKLDRVGRHDNFFDLGGHSLLAVRCVAEAARKGTQFTLRDLFRNQTVVELALVATEREIRNQVSFSADGDEVPIAPVQHWFFGMHFKNPCLWNTSVLLHTPQAVRIDLLRDAVAVLVERHDALRLQFKKVKEQWIQYVEGANDDRLFQTFDLSALPETYQLRELTRNTSEIHAGLRFGQGRLVRFAFFNLGERGNRLFIAVHHLLCDGISLQVLAEELEDIYSDLEGSPSATKIPPPASFIGWARHLHDATVIEQARAGHSYWLSQKGLEIPVASTDSVHTMDLQGRLSLSIPKYESQSLVSLAQRRYRSGIDAVLLWALASTIMDWIHRPYLSINMVGHSREATWSGGDLSRMVGWLSVHYPLPLELPFDLDDEHALAKVVNALELVPQHGLGWGILRYIDKDRALSRQVAMMQEPDIGFNYIGNFDITLKKDAMFRLAQESTGRSRDPVDESRRARKLTLFCHILDHQLYTDWIFMPNLFESQTIMAWAHILRGSLGIFFAPDYLRVDV